MKGTWTSEEYQKTREVGFGYQKEGVGAWEPRIRNPMFGCPRPHRKDFILVMGRGFSVPCLISS